MMLRCGGADMWWCGGAVAPPSGVGVVMPLWWGGVMLAPGVWVW